MYMNFFMVVSYSEYPSSKNRSSKSFVSQNTPVLRLASLSGTSGPSMAAKRACERICALLISAVAHSGTTSFSSRVISCARSEP